jgi:type IV pilus assembly protein PilB
VLLVSEDVERMIVERAHTDDIKKIAIAQGMSTLRSAGMAQVRNGLTSVEEILRVIV